TAARPSGGVPTTSARAATSGLGGGGGIWRRDRPAGRKLRKHWPQNRASASSSAPQRGHFALFGTFPLGALIRALPSARPWRAGSRRGAAEPAADSTSGSSRRR